MESAEAERLRSAAVRSLRDSCRIALRVLTENALGEQVPSWPAWGDEVACGYAPAAGRRIQRADGNLFIADAGLRLSLDLSIAAGDRVRITKRGGVLLNPPVEYEVLTTPRPGLLSRLVDLQEVV